MSNSILFLSHAALLVLAVVVIYPSMVPQGCDASDPEANPEGTSSRLTAEAPPTPEDSDNSYAELDPEELSRMESDRVYLKDSHKTTVVFKQAKLIAGPIGFGHLIWEVNLDAPHLGHVMSLQVVANITRDVGSGSYSTKKFGPRLAERLSDRTNSFNRSIGDVDTQWQNLVSVFSPPEYRSEYLARTHQRRSGTSSMTDDPHPRVDRAVGILVSIVLTILGAVGGFFSATQLSELSSTDERDSIFIVKEMAILGKASTSHEERLFELRERLTRAETFAWLEHENQLIASYETFYDRQLTTYRHDRERQTRALEGLLRKQLSPSLISPPELKAAVRQLKQQAERNGYSLPSDNELYLYQLEAGFVLVRPGVIHVSIHVPMYKRSEVLQLYEAITMPLILPHSRHNLDIQLESKMIAVRGRGEGYKLLEPWQLTACSSMAGVLFCPGEDHMLKDFSMHCISALYHEPLKVSRVCRAVLIPPQVKVVQLEARTFQVFHPTEMTLHQACPNGINPDVSFQGTKLIVLTAGCWAYTDAYELAAPEDISLNFSTKTAETVWGGDKLLRGLTPSQINVVVPAKLYAPVPIDDVLSRFEEQKNAPRETNWFEVVGITCACIGATIGVVLLVSFCKREAIRRSLHSFIVKHPHIALLVDMLPGYLQPERDTPYRLFGKKKLQGTEDDTQIMTVRPTRDEQRYRRDLAEQSAIQDHTRQRETAARAYWQADELSRQTQAAQAESNRVTRRIHDNRDPNIAARRQSAALDREAEDQQRVQLWRSFNPNRSSGHFSFPHLPTVSPHVSPPNQEELNYLSEGPHGHLTRTVEAELQDLRNTQTYRVVPARRQLRRPLQQVLTATQTVEEEAEADQAAVATAPAE